MNAPAALQVRGVTRLFRMGDVEVRALADVSLDIDAGEFLVSLGPSGSGKSTLLNLIGGIDRPTAGRILYRGQDLTALGNDGLTAYRRDEVGFIFQFYNLVPTLTALENVQVAAELIDDPLDAGEALALVGLDDRRDHFPAQLSGGEQQRVAIARALVKKPSLLLADEPTGALDLPTARRVLAILQELNRRQGLTIVLITHNPSIGDIGTRVIRLVSGRVAESRIVERPLPADQVTW
jgi:putative ABC transport system ATP-binding protein